MQGSKRGEGSRKQHGRLPVIAPKDNQSSSTNPQRNVVANAANVAVPPRSRLPPRSRTGCWTCRTRKVKCDEGRPNCGVRAFKRLVNPDLLWLKSRSQQCTRLGHNCDYSPRLSFRDDTPRTVEKMQEVYTTGSAVWDAKSPSSATTTTFSSPDDGMPPFAALETDEEREKKAESQNPGTYHVVVNPDSFAHLPEYYEELNEPSVSRSPELRRDSLALSTVSSVERDTVTGTENSFHVEDENTVIVRRFEDTSRRGTFSSKDGRILESPVVPRARLTTESSLEEVEPSRTVQGEFSLLRAAAGGKKDSALLDRFRSRVIQQVVHFSHERADSLQQDVRSPGAEIFEEAAAFSPPLFHAMMAVSALSLSHRDGVTNLDALQHYQQVLSFLKSEEDLTSDVTFLTHLLLLLYEIAAAEPGGSNLWSQHLTQLLQISMRRRNVFGGERYPFFIWWLCNIDLYALLSGAGLGGFVGSMLNNDILPPPSFHLCPLGADGSSVVYGEEAETLPIILQLNYDVTLIAVRMGLLARELRTEASEYAFTSDMLSQGLQIDAKLRQSRIQEVQESLRQIWTLPHVVELENQVEDLPPRPRQVLEHALLLSRACMIYSHTSMWPTQRFDNGPDFDGEIAECITQIFQLAESIISQGRLHSRFIVFPLFIAGVSSHSGAEKRHAMDLIASMEKESLGANTSATRRLLQVVYERQTERFMRVGHSLDVNWMAIMADQEIQIVNFGL